VENRKLLVANAGLSKRLENAEPSVPI